MKKNPPAPLFLLLALALSACSTFTPAPTETPVPTATSLPSATLTPSPTNTSTPTNTPVPSNTPTPTFTPSPTKTRLPPTQTPSVSELPLPVGTPAASWKGIPVMPGALAGEGDSTGYSFTIQAAAEEIQKFYTRELANLGWNLLANGTGTKNAVLMIFLQGTDTLSVSIFPQPTGVMLVLLVK